MPQSKKQMLRRRRFVGQLKGNRYPSLQSFVADLERSGPGVEPKSDLFCKNHSKRHKISAE